MSHQYDKCITLQHIRTPQATQSHSVQTNTRVCAATVNPNLRNQTDCLSSWGLEAQFKVLLLDLLECWSLGKMATEDLLLRASSDTRHWNLMARALFYWVHNFTTSWKKNPCYFPCILNANPNHVFYTYILDSRSERRKENSQKTWKNIKRGQIKYALIPLIQYVHAFLITFKKRKAFSFLVFVNVCNAVGQFFNTNLQISLLLWRLQFIFGGETCYRQVFF